MRKLLSIMMMALMALAMNAKTVETTLWEDTYSDGVEIKSETVATFKAGNVLRVYVTVPEGGANFKIVYKGEGNSWAETKIPSINNDWPWVNSGEATYYDVTFTESDITALSGMGIYIYKGDNSTVTKVTLLTEEADEQQGDETTLWEDTYSDGVEISSTTIATFSAGDVLRVYVTVPENGANFKIVYKGNDNNWSETAIPSLNTDWPWVNGGEAYKDITLTAADLTAIGTNNIYIYKGESSTITKVTHIKGQPAPTPTPVQSDIEKDDSQTEDNGDSHTEVYKLGDSNTTVTVTVTKVADTDGADKGAHGTLTATGVINGDNIDVTLTATPEDERHSLNGLPVAEIIAGDFNSDQPDFQLAPRRAAPGVGVGTFATVTDNGDGTYSFTMPKEGSVIVTAQFIKSVTNPVAKPTVTYDEDNNKVTAAPGAASDGFVAAAKMYYTTDGSDPRSSETRKEATAETTIDVTADMTVVKVVDVDASGEFSEIVEQAVARVSHLTVTKEWVAFCSPKTFIVPDGLEAYTIEKVELSATAGESGTLTLTKREVINKETPMLILKTSTDQTTFVLKATEDQEIAGCSEFKGVTAATTLSANSGSVYYVLKDGAFMRANPGAVSAYNCYLEVAAIPQSQNTPRFDLNLGGNLTGIESLTSKCRNANAILCDLQGRKVAQPTKKGLYILNGRKVVIK